MSHARTQRQVCVWKCTFFVSKSHFISSTIILYQIFLSVIGFQGESAIYEHWYTVQAQCILSFRVLFANAICALSCCSRVCIPQHHKPTQLMRYSTFIFSCVQCVFRSIAHDNGAYRLMYNWLHLSSRARACISYNAERSCIKYEREREREKNPWSIAIRLNL